MKMRRFGMQALAEEIISQSNERQRSVDFLYTKLQNMSKELVRAVINLYEYLETNRHLKSPEFLCNTNIQELLEKQSKSTKDVI